MSKPLLILDQHFRRVDELFSDDCLTELSMLCRIEGGRDQPMDPAVIDGLVEEASFLVAARPRLQAGQIARAKNLKAIIEVSGAFNEGLDYDASLEAGIEILSSMPGFRQSVAEMALSMILASARGLVDEHEAFRKGVERWVDDRDGLDFTLFRQNIGFVGYGQIARETHRLLLPFNPTVRAYDPWLKDAGDGVQLVGLDEVMARSRVVIVAASPTHENRHLVGAEQISQMQKNALLVLISRAHCVDFDAMIAAADAGKIKAAIDVFPDEPLGSASPVRQMRNVILSPHRAAAVPGGRQLIGEMILADITAILDGRTERELKRADPAHLGSLVGAHKGLAVEEE